MNLTLYSFFRKLPISLLLILLIQALSSQQAHATHAMGADLTYECLGGDTYEFTLSFYRDCAPGAAPASASYPLTISSASCGELAIIVVNQTGPAIDISPLCPADKPNSTCNGGTLPGVEQYTYTATYTLPQNCTDWVIQWENCCRNGAITNSTINTLTTETVIQATLDNLSVSCNSSPTFTTIPIPYVCAGQTYFFNHGAFDPDGDSLAFELTDPLEKNAALVIPVPYNGAFTPAYPISTIPANNFSFDPQTGQMSFTPAAIQNGIVALLVKQYRNGVLIGTTMRDIQLVVISCTNTSPVISPPANITGGSLAGNTFAVCAGNTLTFNITATDIDAGDLLAAGSTITSTIPGATFTASGSNPVTGTISWPTSLANVGNHTFTLTVSDNACPIPSNQVIGFDIIVQDQVEILVTDTLICPGTAQTVQLQAVVNGAGGTGSFAWTPVTGLSNPNIANPTATVSGPETYTVTYTEGVCSSTDQVNLISEGSLAVTPAAPTVCNGATVQLNATYTAAGTFTAGNCGISASTCSGPSTTNQVGTSTNTSGTTGTTGGQGSPYLGLYSDARMQVLFRASELTAAGVTPGLISDLAMEVFAKNSTAPYNGFTIKIGCTESTQLTSFVPGLSTVFAGNVTTAPGWNTHVFTNPYEWDGISNLIVEFCFDNLLSSGLDQVFITPTTYNSTAFQRANFTTGCNLTTPSLSTQRPNVRFASCAIAVPITYSWTPTTGLSNPNISNPIASPTANTTYTVTVNTPSCSFTDNVAITVQQPPTLNPLTNQAICSGNSVNLNTSGTNLAGATYSWTPATGLSNAAIANPVASPTTTTTYTVTASNSCGSDAETITLTVNQAPAVSLASTNISCNNANDGTILATASGGGGGYTYAWTPNVGTGSAISNLPGATYSVVVTDANTCTATATATIINPAAVVASVPTQINVDCFGASTGSITTAGSGGTPGYTYSIDGTNFQTSPTFAGLAAGTITLTVRDANNCIGTLPVTLTQPAAPVSVGLVNQTNADCNVPNGALTAAGAGGTAPYSYSIDGTTFQTSGTFTALSPGIYVVTVQDANLCTSTLNVNITAPTAPVGTISAQTNVDCNGNTNGAFTITATGGNPGYLFSIDGVTFGASGTFTGLSANLYIATIRDAIGCETQIAVNITEPAIVSGNISAQNNVDCNGNSTGSFTITGTGGTPAYQYSIDGVNFFAGGTFSNLAAATYTVTIRDPNLCTGTVPVILTEPQALAATSLITPVDCNGASTGSIAVTPTGGTPNYEYSLNGLTYSPLNTFTGLTAGTYTVFVRDNNNCVITLTETVSEPVDLTGSITSQSNINCNGLTNGAVTVGGSGGVGTYQYSIDGITFQAGGTFTGLVAGMYTVTVRDANGCTEPVQVNIIQPSPLTITPTALLNASCNGLADGSVVAASTGGTPGYQFSLDGITFSPNSLFQNLAAGTYTLTVQDANGCTQSSPFTLTQPDAVLGSISSQTNVDCNGAATGAVSVTASGGNGGTYQYSIDGISFSPTGAFGNLTAGAYTLTFMDGNGCTSTLPLTITEPPILSGSLQAQINIDCNGAASGSFSAIGVGGTPPYAYSINGVSFGPSGTFANLTAGAYTLSIRDANNCLITLPLTLTEPPVLTANLVSQINVDCGGSNTGSFVGSGSGGTAPYQYAIDGATFSGSDTFTGLTAGNYTLTIQDANGCTDDVSVTITEPIQVVGTLTAIADADCNGAATGSVSIMGTGGTPGYTYSIDGINYTPNGTFNNLTAGTWDLIVADVNGCSDTVSVIITEPIAIVASIPTQTHIDCNGAATGSLTALAVGGTAPYQYSIDGVSFSNSPNFTGLIAGPYTLTVQDANGCMTTATTTLTEPTAILIVPSLVSDVSCNGGNDGAVSSTVSGGTGPYTYSWSPGGGNGPGLSNLVAGTYTLSITDANGCIDNESIVVNEPAALTASIAVVSGISCGGQADGILEAVVNGGTGPYTYAWTPGTGNTNQLSGLATGQYDVAVTDANGCTTAATFVLTEPDPVLATVSITDALCNGTATGTASAVVSGGTSPYTYLWNNDPSLTLANLSNLSIGIYEVIATDANGCTDTASMTINQPNAIALTSSFTNETCTDANGTASVSAVGGVGGFTYSWDSSPTQATSTAVNLPAGTYTVTVTDLNGCMETAAVNLIDEAAPVLAIQTQSNISCFGLSDGSATVVATGGTGTYTYLWDFPIPVSGPSISGLIAGDYFVIVDDGQCSDTLTVSLTEPDVLTAAISTFSIPSCFGGTDGMATVSLTGGTAPFTYNWSTPNPVNSPTASGLPSGTYAVTVTDANGCQATAQVTLTDPLPLTLSLDPTNVSCFGGDDGSIDALTDGGVPPYAYTWSTGTTQATASGLSLGSFWVIVTDANGCSITASTEITQPTLLEITTSHTDLVCFESADGTASVSATGGTPGYQYNWSNGDVSPTANALIAGPYSIEVTDENGCHASAEVLVGQPDSILISLVDESIAYCNLANGTLLVDATGGIPVYQYSWNTSPAQEGPFATDLFGGTFGGPHVVTVTDANGCQNELAIPLENLVPPIASFQTNPELGQEVALSKAALEFSNTSTGAVAYLWDFGDGSPFTDLENPAYTYTEPGTYTIILTAIDPNNTCPDTTMLTFTIIPDGVLFFPNAFSPNGDGHNDEFFISGEGVVGMELIIFDRWGVEVKRLFDPSETWDGTNANGSDVQEGVYVYVIKATMNNGAVLDRGGSITLIR